MPQRRALLPARQNRDVDLAATKPVVLLSDGASMYEKILNPLFDLLHEFSVMAVLVTTMICRSSMEDYTEGGANNGDFHTSGG